MSLLIPTIRNLVQISQDEEIILADLFKPSTLKSGEYFLEEGQLCRYVGFIESGLVRYHMNDNGVQKTYVGIKPQSLSRIRKRLVTSK
jgi:hypothetical protein